MADGHLKRWPTSSGIRERETGTPVSCRHTLTRRAKITFRNHDIRGWLGCVETGSLIYWWCEWKMVQSLWESLSLSYKTKHALTIEPSVGIPGHVHQRNENLRSHKNLSVTFTAAYSKQPLIETAQMLSTEWTDSTKAGQLWLGTLLTMERTMDTQQRGWILRRELHWMKKSPPPRLYAVWFHLENILGRIKL